jgi:hypothetical protein
MKPEFNKKGFFSSNLHVQDMNLKILKVLNSKYITGKSGGYDL